MARASSTSAPTARHSSCARSISSTPRRSPGSACRYGPFVSPDGQWIGFFDGVTALKKVAITGGPAVTLGRPDGTALGASWGPDGTIIFATNDRTTGLQRIAAAGGEPTVLTRPNRAGGEDDHLWPEILPGGQAVLFTITATTGGLDQAQVAVLDLRTGTQTVLIRGGSDARYVSSGHLVYAAAGSAARRRLRPRPARCRRHAGDGPARGADDGRG